MLKVLSRKFDLQRTKNKKSFSKTLLSLAAAVGLISAITLTTVSAASTVTWTGQGVTNGTLNTSQCDAQNTPYIFWVFTGGSNVTSATITIKSNNITVEGPTAMTQQGGGSYHYTSGFYDLSTIGASVSYEGTASNPQLVISHGCAGATAKVSLTKTFAQGVFTALPASGDACFTLSPAAGTSTATQCSNTPEWDGLPVGSYTIIETTTPAGYTTISPINFIVRNDCTGLTNCVETGNATATSLGTFQNTLLPGHLRVSKLLGPAPGTAWTGPSVSFSVCANNPASSPTEQTTTQCNATSATFVETLTVSSANPVNSGNLVEGYYTVCENTLSGYTVDDQCQVVAVHAGSTAAANTVTFINTPTALFWCSPGFWATAIKQNRTGVLNYLTNNGVDLNTLYSTINGAPLKAGAPANPTIRAVLLSPQTYGGPAFNSVADYISAQLGWGGTQLTGENCPLNAQGIFTPTTFLTVL